MKKIKILFGIGLLTFMLYSFNTLVQEAWIVPAKYESMKNPVDAQTDKAIGKSLYNKHCKSCHGKEGYGDGPKADELDGEMADLSTEDVQNQSDGALYYKSIIGRDDMPEFTKKIKEEEDRWLIINYVRTLAE